jgi:hypothetical protein
MKSEIFCFEKTFVRVLFGESVYLFICGGSVVAVFGLFAVLLNYVVCFFPIFSTFCFERKCSPMKTSILLRGGVFLTRSCSAKSR